MILTVTMNASVDITYIMNDFRLNETNRVDNIRKTAGGKGLNVTRVLAQTGAGVFASGLAGGTTGAFIERQLQSTGIPHQFFMTENESRNNISIISGGCYTEILEKGSPVSQAELEGFLHLYRKLLRDAGTVVLSGSLPAGVPDDFYGQLIQEAAQAGVRALLDTSGRYLKAGISSACKPFLIKPNEKEIGDLSGMPVNPGDPEQIMKTLLSPVFDGIPYVLVSLGKHGGVLRHEDTFWNITVPQIEAVNPIGSGDSVMAGIAGSLDQNDGMMDAIRRGMTFGVLNAMEPLPGKLNLQRYTEIHDGIRIAEIQQCTL